MFYQKRPRILLLITCGWAVRNYLRSGFLETLKSELDIVVMLPNHDRSLESEVRAMGINAERFYSYPLPQKLAFLNGLLVVADSYHFGYYDPHLWDWVVALQSPLKQQYFRLHQLVGRCMSFSLFYKAARWLERHWLKEVSKKGWYSNLFNEIKPDIVLSTNPYSIDELFVTLQAIHRKIPTVAAIVSWDNLSYKGHLLANYSYYLLWSEAMQEDLLCYQPDLRKGQIFIVGTPQFDFHLRQDLICSREDFFRRIGGDPKRKLITYSANTKDAFPSEPEVVAQLWDAILRGYIIDNPQLLVRLHPNDTNERFASLRERCQGILLSRPWPYYKERESWFTPSLEELALLSNTLRYTDVNVNLASTMTLDTAIFDKPTVNVAFTAGLDNSRNRRVAHCHESCHYRQVIESKAAKVAFSLEELIKQLNVYLKSPELSSDERKRLVKRICGPVDGKAYERIAHCILGFLKESPKT